MGKKAKRAKMPAKLTIAMGMILMAVAALNLYFAHETATDNALWDDAGTADKIKYVTGTGQFGTGCTVLALSFVVLALYEPPIILDDQ